MARGYPDYFGQSIWPKFGTMLHEQYNEYLPGGIRADLLSLSLQGQLSWGTIWIDGIATAPSFDLYLTVDDMVNMRIDENDFLRIGPDGSMGYPWKCSYFKSNGWIIQVSLAFPIPFHDTFKVELDNTGVDDLDVLADFAYYHVT